MKEKIKILYIIDMYCTMGGAEKNLYELVQHIDKRKFTPYVVCLKGGKLALMTQKIGVWIKNLDLKRIYGLRALKEGINLFKLIKRERFQIVVTYHKASDFWGGLIAKLAGVPVLISSRRDMGYKLKKRHIWLYRLFNHLFDQIISVSNAVKEAIVKREWTNPKKIVTIYNGVDVSKYCPEIDKISFKKELGLDGTKKIVGMVANFREIKGQIYFVQAISEVLKEFKDVQFLIVGYKDTDYFSKVKELIEKLGLEEYVFCPGAREDIPEILSIFDISVLSSINEGFSNIILESMASGKPVIAARSGGNPESVIDGEIGLLFTPRNSQELSDAILKLLKNEGLRIQMGKNGREKVAKDFTLNKMVSKIEELYDYLLLYKKLRFKNIFDSIEIIKDYYIKRYAKLIICYFLYYLGIIPIYVRYFKKPTKILAYHSVGNNYEGYFGMRQKTEAFEKQMQYLNDYYNVISLSNFCESLNNGDPEHNSIVVTFDDGYHDNYTNAFPILKKYNIPATIFVSTNPVVTGEPLFFDMLVYAIYNTQKKYLDLSEIGLQKYLLTNRFLKFKAIKEINFESKKMNIDERKQLIKYIFKQSGLNFEDSNKKQLYLTWEQIIEMHRWGIEIGAHTESHPCLSSLSEDEIRSEIYNSKEILEKKLGNNIDSFAYPYGGRSDYNEDIKSIVKKAGFKYACILGENESKRDNDLFTLGRKTVTNSITMGFSGKFSMPLFAAEVSGFLNIFRRNNPFKTKSF